MRVCLALLLMLAMGQEIFSQRTCSTEFVQRDQPAMALREMASDEVIIIPVVVHILYNTPEQNISNERVISQLEALNRDYRMTNSDASLIPAPFRALAGDTRIEFCLAKSDPLNRPTTGIIRKATHVSSFIDESMKNSSAGGSDAWNTDKYLNIWVCNLFGRSLGFATFPGGEANLDGVVINFDVFGTGAGTRAPYNMGRTATHEVAHWLGLKHIWGDNYCGSDDVNDTPAQEGSNYGCPTFPRMSTCSPNGFGDMYMNFMDLTDDACMLMFTRGQKEKMRSVFTSGGFRNAMLTSSGCLPGTASPGPEPGPQPETPASSVLQVKAYPNPFVQYFQLEAEEGMELNGQIISVYNAQGKLMIRTIARSEIIRVEASQLQKGVYFLRVGDGKEVPTIKLLKQ